MPLFTVYHHENEVALFSSECTVGALNTALMELALGEKQLQPPSSQASVGVSSLLGGKTASPWGPGERRRGSIAGSSGGGTSFFGDSYTSPPGTSTGRGGGTSGSASQAAKSKRIGQIASLACSLLEPSTVPRGAAPMLDSPQASKPPTNVSVMNASIRNALPGSQENVERVGGDGGSKKKGGPNDSCVLLAPGVNTSSSFYAGHRSSPLCPHHYHKLELLPVSYLNDLLSNPKLLVALQAAAVQQRDQQQQHQQQLAILGAVTASAAVSSVPGSGVGDMSNTVGGAGSASSNAAALQHPSGVAAPDASASSTLNAAAFPGGLSLSNGTAGPGSSSAAMATAGPILSSMLPNSGGSGAGAAGPNHALTSLLHSIPFVGLMTMPVHNAILDTCAGGSAGYILLGCREKSFDSRGNEFHAPSVKSTAAASLASPGAAFQPIASSTALPGGGSGGAPNSSTIVMSSAEGGPLIVGKSKGGGDALPLPTGSSTSSGAVSRSLSPHNPLSTLPPPPSQGKPHIGAGKEKGVLTSSAVPTTTTATAGNSSTSCPPVPATAIVACRGGPTGDGGRPLLLSDIEVFSGETLRSAGYGVYVVEKCGGYRSGAQGAGGGMNSSVKRKKGGGGTGYSRDRRGVGDDNHDIASSAATLPYPLPLSKLGAGNEEDDETERRGKGGWGGTLPPTSSTGRSDVAAKGARGGGIGPHPQRSLSQPKQETLPPSLFSSPTSVGAGEVGGERGSENGRRLRAHHHHYNNNNTGSSDASHFPFSQGGSARTAIRSTDVNDLIQAAQKLASQPISRTPLQVVSALPSLAAAVAAGGCPGMGDGFYTNGGTPAAPNSTTGGDGSSSNNNGPGSANTAGSGGCNFSTSVAGKKGEKGGGGKRGGSLSLEENVLHYGPRRLLTKEISPTEIASTSAASHSGGGDGAAGLRTEHGDGGKVEEEGNGEEGWGDPFQATQPPFSNGNNEGRPSSSISRGQSVKRGGGAGSPRGGKENKNGGENTTPKKNTSGRGKGGGGGGDSPSPSSNASTSAKAGGSTNSRGVSTMLSPAVIPLEGEGEDGEPVLLEVHSEVPLSGAACGILYNSPLSFTVVMNTGSVTARPIPGTSKRNQVEDSPRSAVATMLANNPEDGLVVTPHAGGGVSGGSSGAGGGGGSGGAQGGSGVGSGAGGGNSNNPGCNSNLFPSGGAGGPKTHILERMEAFDVLWRGTSGEHEILAWILQEYLKMMKAKIAAVNQQPVWGSTASGADDAGKKDSKRRRTGSGGTAKKK